ncbi:flagellar hook-basal body complex protein FliE [Geobacter argillaceus]|uniref:Flagellar hook-basal body complex protein FliE n=1 Tax=Geobacter argillaceus TaxID=345631 RepID=A0A562VJ83_9BACT|nr:flagellar hook-basal body complex protein FliE [Geobacter argillaceus]TWJ18026.1 flagellar hook-basal body complex protein FliE [Geobacter argillaceus]
MIIKGIETGGGLEQAFKPAKEAVQTQSPAVSFASYLGEMVSQVNSDQQASDKAVQELATGQARGLHEVMIAMEKSSISFQFLTQVRNKVVEAYQEVMRMPV